MSRRRAVIAAFAGLTAALVPSISEAHDFTSNTSLTRLKVPAGEIERGDRVVLIGRLRSSDPVCHSEIVVGLYRVETDGDRVVARDVTDGGGEYVFQRRPRYDQTLYVRFEGFIQTLGGHSHACGESRSPEVNVRVVL